MQTMKTRFLFFVVVGCAALAVSSRGAAPTDIASNITHTTLHGLEVYTLPTGVRDVVTIVGSLPAGDAATRGGNPAIATLVGDMLDQGTRKQDKFAIAEKLEAVGAELSFSVSNDSLNIYGRCLWKDLPVVLHLLIEQLREPAFDAEEFERVKARLIGGMQRSLEDPETLSDEAFNNAIYPTDHPNYATPVATFVKAVDEATLDEVKAFHASHYGPNGLLLALVGDIDPTEVTNVLAGEVTDWAGGSSVVRAALPATSAPDQDTTVNVDMPDKTSISVVWGQSTGLTYRDADSLALDVGTAILGSGFTGRLMANVRDKEGLTYGIYADNTRDTYNDGEWFIKATFAPELLNEGIASTRRQLESWYRDGVTAAELAERKTNLIGSYKLQLATTRGLGGTILRTVQRGLPLTSIDTYAERVDALTLAEVNGVIRKYLNPENMIQVRAGTLPGGQ